MLFVEGATTFHLLKILRDYVSSHILLLEIKKLNGDYRNM